MVTTSPQCQEDQNRADYMEYLFGLYKRDSDETPLGLRHTFTGLAAQHRMHLGTLLMDEIVQNWHFNDEEYREADTTHPPKIEYPDQPAEPTSDGDSCDAGLSAPTDEHEGNSENSEGSEEGSESTVETLPARK